MGGWQDWLVTGVAGVALAIVLWRTLGSWTASKPGGAGSPHCDGCVVAEAARTQAQERSVEP